MAKKFRIKLQCIIEGEAESPEDMRHALMEDMELIGVDGYSTKHGKYSIKRQVYDQKIIQMTEI